MQAPVDVPADNPDRIRRKDHPGGRSKGSRLDLFKRTHGVSRLFLPILRLTGQNRSSPFKAGERLDAFMAAAGNAQSSPPCRNALVIANGTPGASIVSIDSHVEHPPEPSKSRRSVRC